MDRRKYVRIAATVGAAVLPGCNRGHDPPLDEEPTPSDSVERLEAVEPGRYGEFSIDGEEDHYFGIDPAEGERLTVSIEYAHEEGPIGLNVLDQDSAVLAESRTDDDGETITITVEESEIYVINPFSRADTSNTYHMEIAVD